LYIARSSRLSAGGVVGVAMLAAWVLAAAFFPSAGGGPRSTVVERAPSRCTSFFGLGEHLSSSTRLGYAVDLEFGYEDGEDDAEERDEMGGPRCRLFGATDRRLPASRRTASESRSSEETQHAIDLSCSSPAESGCRRV
jgi:hypothetical protein